MRGLALALMLIAGCGPALTSGALTHEVARAHACASRDIAIESVRPEERCFAGHIGPCGPAHAWVVACGWHRHYVASSSGWREEAGDATQLGFSAADRLHGRIMDQLMAEVSAEHGCADVAVIEHDGSSPTNVWLLACGHQRLYVREGGTWNEHAPETSPPAAE